MFSYPLSRVNKCWSYSSTRVRREKMKRLMLPLGAAILVSLLGVAPAGAFTMTQKCVIANQLCFVTRVAAGGMTAEDRLNRVNERLAYILGYESLRPNNIRMVAMPS